MKKTTIFGIIIVVLFACNIFLLYTNTSRQNQLNAMAVQNDGTQSAELTADDVLSQNAKVTHSGVDLPDSGLSLLVFFTIRSCSSCLEYEVPNLNGFYEQFPQHTQAYLITGGNPFLEQYGAKFSSEIITPTESVLNVDMAIDNPVAVLTDSSGIIHGLYLSEIGNKQKSDRFYKRMNSFFSSIR